MGQSGTSGTRRLVVSGSLTRDLDPADSRGWRVGGAAAYAALTAARLGLEVVALVGVDAVLAGAAELDLLADAGVQVRPVAIPAAPVFENREGPGGRRQRRLEAGARMPVPPRTGEIADAAWLLAPVGDELGEAWVGAPARGAFLALGLQGWLRRVGADGTVSPDGELPPAFRGRADVIALSIEDVPPQTDLAAVQRLAKPGGTALLTAGDRGGLALIGSRRVAWPPVPPAVAADATGAGDVFLAAYLAARLLAPPAADGTDALADDAVAKDALVVAAAAASCALEGSGLGSVPSREAVIVRMQVAIRRRARGGGGGPGGSRSG